MRIKTILLALFLAGIVFLIQDWFPIRGYVLGSLIAAVTYLLLEMAALRRRVGELESSLVQPADRVDDLPPTISLPPRQTEGVPPSIVQPHRRAEDVSPPPKPVYEVYELELEEWEDLVVVPEASKSASTAASQPANEEAAGSKTKNTFTAKPQPPPADQFIDLFSMLFRWLTGGNPILKAGIVVLFFGVAFLLSYAAQRNLFPIELRLAGVVVGGLALLLLGWRLRHKHTLYGVGLEGAGIGILYLVVFAAVKLYRLDHLLPLPLALAVMIGLVGLSCALAILQNARGLAVAGSVGGFLAPILMSTGSGSHVLLFSYYTLLNCGILAIAWFKSWRELNLTGFIFTFGIAAAWGVKLYSPAQFATTEPFLILFFVMYCLISVLFAHRQPLHLRGYIDGPLVFGLPVVASGFQAHLVSDLKYGLAFSALALGGWYIGLARLLWRRMVPGMRLLTEAFLAMGIVFASLAIPLGLDAQWSSAAWALEGGAMMWVGVRQNRITARIFGLLLQLGAAITFITSWHGDAFTSLVLVDRFFLGCALIAIAALFSADWLDREPQRATWESLASPGLLFWGLIWWYGGGIMDLNHHVHGDLFFIYLLLFAAVSTVGFAVIGHWTKWWRLSIAAFLLLLPLMIIVLAQYMTMGGGCYGEPLLIGWGWLAWPLAIVLQYGLLYHLEDQLDARILPRWHNLTLWVLLAIVTIEIAQRVGQLPDLAEAWEMASWGLVPVVLLILLQWRGNRLAWPVTRFAPSYHGPGIDVPLALLLLWTLITFFYNGNPAPLPYLPLANPLELVEAAVLLLAGYRIICAPSNRYQPRPPFYWLVTILAFWYLNTVVARSVHFFAEVPYRLSNLFASPILQAGIAVLWSVLALTLTVWGARKSLRQVWLAGAGLLGLTVVKLFFIDLAGTGAIGRIVSFLVVGLLMLVIGFFAPLPPKNEETKPMTEEASL
ncbi:MAG: DUF2339 domain-containing protein [Proteobacteria bacterium]|nr:DUF2339 domain-containing protein [Pseudomonadota bacterium]